MTALILDSEALSNLARSRPGRGLSTVLTALRAAVDEGARVVVPAAVLSELYRGGPHDQVIDSYLGRSTGVEVIDTTRSLARVIGHLLARAGRGSKDHVDATVIAAAIAVGGGVILTGDPDDLTALGDGTVGVSIEAL